MIVIKNSEQLKKMRVAGRITGEAIVLAGEAVREGVTTKHLDDIIRRHIEKCGARPSFLGYGGFPGSACISVNEQVIHGIPSPDIILKEGDIVKIDVGAFKDGFHGDSANTFAVGKISPEAQRLIDVTKESFRLGAAHAVPGGRLGDVGHAIQEHVEAAGFSVVRKYVGHGVGEDLHEDPNVPNYGTPGRGVRLCRGMVIAIEPMVNAGTYDVKELRDGWTVVTRDGKLSAHYEHTVAITDDGPEFLTMV
ncbi:MAG: type I methionyl aminopeptidase [Clostridia bacterium]|nr:type I methionyl aminopeptidase [Clostridia bacterium]